MKKYYTRPGKTLKQSYTKPMCKECKLPNNTCCSCAGNHCDSCYIIFNINDINDNILTKTLEDMTIGTGSENLFKRKRNVFWSLEPRHFIKNNELWVSYYTVSSSEGIHIEDAQCNINSPDYKKTFKETFIKYKLYKKCNCKDKNVDVEFNCFKYGCNDTLCYHEMELHNRTQKKIYPIGV